MRRHLLVIYNNRCSPDKTHIYNISTTTTSVGHLKSYRTVIKIILTFSVCFRVSVWQSGMRLKYATMDGLSICYGEKGKRKKGSVSMLLLHGFTADKFMWVPLVRVREKLTCM